MPIGKSQKRHFIILIHAKCSHFQSHSVNPSLQRAEVAAPSQDLNCPTWELEHRVIHLENYQSFGKLSVGEITRWRSWRRDNQKRSNAVMDLMLIDTWGKCLGQNKCVDLFLAILCLLSCASGPINVKLCWATLSKAITRNQTSKISFWSFMNVLHGWFLGQNNSV